MHDDTTYCADECLNFDCPRNKVHVLYDLPEHVAFISFSHSCFDYVGFEMFEG